MLFFLTHHWYVLVPLVPTLAGVAYQILVFTGIRQFFGLRGNGGTESKESTPPISILKPVKGYDPGAYESFRSHCVQDYPEYEIIFGLSHAEDAAAPLIEQLRREFPQRKIEAVVCPPGMGPNPKIGQLMQMIPAAPYENLVINRGRLRAARDYLRHAIRPVRFKQLGMSTCLIYCASSNSL